MSVREGVIEALTEFSNGLLELSNANDCHDDKGLFCEGGSSGGGALGRAARDHERMTRDDALPGGARLDMESRESLRPYTDKWLRNTPPGEREAIDYDRQQLGKDPIDWARVDAKPAKPTGGIGPERSVATAERRGKEYGYAKKVSFYQCKSVDQVNEINWQMAELSDETGLELERVYVYKEGGKSKEAPKSSLGYQTGRGSDEDKATIGIRNGVTAAYCYDHCKFDTAGRAEDLSRWQARVDMGGPSAEWYAQAIAEYREEEGFEGYTFRGNGVRNPTVDHEFAHALVQRAHVSRPATSFGEDDIKRKPDGNPIYLLSDERAKKLNNLGDWCREFNQEKKYSVYGSKNAPTSLFIKSEEPLAETYSYWKAGNPIPERIERGFRRLESFRRVK
jgi:hypothetical protein